MAMNRKPSKTPTIFRSARSCDQSRDCHVISHVTPQDAASRLRHEPHVALFTRVLSGEKRLEAVQQWMTAQASLTQACNQQQDNDVIMTS